MYLAGDLTPRTLAQGCNDVTKFATAGLTTTDNLRLSEKGGFHMTRYKKSDFPTKERRVTIRMTEVQYEVLTTYAEKADMTIASYLRHLIVSKVPTVKYEIVFNSKEILKIFSNLSNVAGNLNQIAHHLNSGIRWSDELRKEVTDNIREVRQMRKDLNEITGEYRGNS